MHGRLLNQTEPQAPPGRLSLMDEAAVDAAVAVTLLMVSIPLHQAQIVAQVLEKNEDKFMASSHNELNSTIAKILAQNHLLPDADGAAGDDDDDEDASAPTAKGGKGAVPHEDESAARSRALLAKKAGRKVGAKVARSKRVRESSDDEGDDNEHNDADEEADAEEDDKHATKRQKTAPPPSGARSRR